MLFRGNLDIEPIKAQARGRWGEIIPQLTGIGPELLDSKHHPCPKCGGKDRFRAFSDFMDTGGVICNQCHNQRNGDGFSTLTWMTEWELPRAIEAVKEYLHLPRTDRQPTLDEVCGAKSMPVASAKAYGAVERGGGVVFPMYGPDGRQSTEFTLNSMGKGLNATGKRAGVFLPHENGEVRLPRPGEQWVIVEGVKDAAALHGLGFLALGLPTNRLNRKFSPLLNGVRCVVAPDLDRGGMEGARATRTVLADVAATVEIAQLPGEIREKRGQDVRALIKELGADDVRTAIMNAFDREQGLVTVSGDQLEETPVTWLWEGWIPEGAISILEGDPGQGKTFAYCDLVARLTTGRPMPLQSEGRDPVHTLILNDEDSHSRVLRPRILACGGNLKLSHFIVGRRVDDGEGAISLPEDVTLIEQVLVRWNVKLLVIENVGAYFGRGLSEDSNQDVRTALLPLAKLAEAKGCSVLLVRHCRKADSTATTRGMGSTAFGAVARSVICIDKHPDDESLRVMASVKSSYGERPTSLELRITDGRVDWVGASELTAEQLSQASRQPKQRQTKVQRALKLILEETGNGKNPLVVDQLLDRAKEEGISERSFAEARKLAKSHGIISGTLGFQGKSYLGSKDALRSLRETSRSDPSDSAQDTVMTESGSYDPMDSQGPVSADVSL